jgi:hypothetical protein
VGNSRPVIPLKFMNRKEILAELGITDTILSGISAPIIWALFRSKKIGRKVLILWNLVCLELLFNIVIRAVLSTPLPFQQFAFDQPNIAVLYFPFVFLPAYIVPAVLLSHLIVLTKFATTDLHKIEPKF